MRIGIILDNPKRDLTGVSLIAYHLLTQGHTTFIVPMYDQGCDVPLLDLDGIIINYARTSNLNFLKVYKKLGLVVFVLDTEGGVMPEFGEGSPEFWAKRVHEIGASRFIDHYMFWGERHYEAFKKHSGIAEDRLHITGSPRHDVCHPKWRPILQHPLAGFVLINLNFPSVNPSWGNARYSLEEDRIICESARAEMNNLSKVIPVDFEKWYRFQDELISTLNEYVRTIRQLASSNPERTFIVRPHPFENQEVYRAFFAGTSNVRVDGTGEVMCVINAADLVLHLNCGTSVETRLLGKVPVSLELLNSELIRCNISVPSEISFPVHRFEDLDNLVKAADGISLPYQARESYCHVIDPWFREVDGRAAERASSIVSRVLSQHVFRSSASRWLYALAAGHESPQGRHLVLGCLAQLIGSRWLARLRNRNDLHRNMKYVSPEVLRAGIEEIVNCDKSQLKFHIMPARHPVTGLELSTLQAAPL